MLMNQYEMKKIFDWMEENPGSLALAIFGVVALVVVLMYIRHLLKMNGGTERYSKKNKHNS